MGQFGCIRRIADLPSQTALRRYIRKAVALNDAGIKPPNRVRKPTTKKVVFKMPDDLSRALARNARARKTFDDFTYTHRKEYIEWVTEARRAETRAKRVATAVRQMSEGKTLHWKYR
jgi:uncharacterized protein YdeI (YjbR/CyaY-like superfamily)